MFEVIGKIKKSGEYKLHYGYLKGLNQAVELYKNDFKQYFVKFNDVFCTDVNDEGLSIISATKTKNGYLGSIYFIDSTGNIIFTKKCTVAIEKVWINNTYYALSTIHNNVTIYDLKTKELLHQFKSDNAELSNFDYSKENLFNKIKKPLIS